MTLLASPIASVPRVGPAYQKKLKKIGIATVHDLLFYFPRTYEDFSVITPINQVKEGNIYCIKGTLLEITQVRTFKKRMALVQAVVQDNTGAIKVLWFNQPYLTDSLKQGDSVYLAGKVIRDKNGIHMASPIHEKDYGKDPVHAGRIVPVYAETAGVSSRWIRSIVYSILSSISHIPETLPNEIIAKEEFPPLLEALWQIHFPQDAEIAKRARERLAFEELFYIMLFILSERKKIASVKAPSIPFSAAMMQRLTKTLPFELTDEQKKAAWQILKDIEKPRPMNRLLQGDVGSGKTVVATMAALSAVKAGYQASIMAPTEILAQQHFKTVSQLLAPLKITVGLLTGKTDRYTSPKLPNDYIEISRTKLLEKVKKEEVQILIGTHTLIQDKVKFGNLALVVLDEQHRFGIKQRAKLLHNSTLIPHLLSMTATPIPRTLALTIYGDLDLSLIAQLPKGRKKIITEVVLPEGRQKTYDFIADQATEGRQVFVICPRIEEGEPGTSELKSVKQEYNKLSEEIFPDFEVGMLHGKMPQKEKEAVMRKFKFGRIDILVSTSVVEVGVDIPNATVMMIEGAERFGLAQLHQFRGRVGRSDHQSYCFLFTGNNSAKTRERLRAMKEAANGFELAEKDLHMRGPGDFSGVKQWGLPDFAMEQLANLSLVEKAREAAKALLEQDITLKSYPTLKERMQEYRTNLHLE